MVKELGIVVIFSLVILMKVLVKMLLGYYLMMVNQDFVVM